MFWLALIAQAGMLPLPAPRPAPKPVVIDDAKRIEVAGWQYAVRLLAGDWVEITGGDPAAPRNTAIMNRFRAAGERTTGCTLRKPSFFESGVRAELDCSARRIP